MTTDDITASNADYALKDDGLKDDGLKDAWALAAARTPHPHESADYGAAREALLAEEIELRRQIERVAARRRALPPGPVVAKDYRFIDANGQEVGLAALFGRHDTLITYFWMYGPARRRPCPMCTATLGPIDANARDLEQRVAFAVLGRSPVERQVAFGIERGWRALRFHQTVGDDYALDFGGLDQDGYEWPVMAVFTRARGADGADEVRLFWQAGFSGAMADPGQDPRGAPDPNPLWNLLDLTPGGRGTDWYPSLSYPAG